MGCFLSCFRGGSDASGDLRHPLVREIRIADAFLNDEKQSDEATGKPDAEAANGHGVDEELRREANYLKSCGTISQTPPEITDSIPIISEDANECSNTPSNVQLMKKDAVLLDENSSELLNSDEHAVSKHEQDPLVTESHIGDAFMNENDEKKSDEATGKPDAEAANGHGVDEELQREVLVSVASVEANYLKSCGTISQTPPEITDSIQIISEDASECSNTPSNVQLMKKDAVLLEENSSELLNSDEHAVSKHEDSQSTDSIPIISEDANECSNTPNVQLMKKDAVLPEENSSELLNSNEHALSKHEQDSQSTDSSDSPYPTPLVLRGDIRTPGTFYTAYKETAKPGKRTRGSRQFIYPVLRPIENKMQWMELKAESPVLASNPPKRRNMSSDSSEKAQQISEYVSFPIHDNCDAQNEVMSPDELKGQNVNKHLDEGEESSKQSSEFGKYGVTSLSHWLKPSSADNETNSKKTWYETGVSDVPIFPAFGLNWETDNPTPVLPKAWDGNGIPNTTTKYKEDQKVSWHATPFEERLLKVLSNEKPHHERKISGKLIHLEENAE